MECGWRVGGTFRREGTYVYLWLIHVDAWQNPTEYCKALTLQLKKISAIAEIKGKRISRELGIETRVAKK